MIFYSYSRRKVSLMIDERWVHVGLEIEGGVDDFLGVWVILVNLMELYPPE
jgi:hypothetical protein